MQKLSIVGYQKNVEYVELWHLILLAVNVLVCAVVLWHFYDSIDDWAFLALQAEKARLNQKPARDPAYDFDDTADMEDLEAMYGISAPRDKKEVRQPLHLLRHTSWQVAYVMSILGMGYLLGNEMWRSLSLTGMDATMGKMLCYLVGGLVFAGLRLWRVHALNKTWRVQIDLVKPGQKYASLLKRIVQCILMAVALGLIGYHGGGVYFFGIMGVFLFDVIVGAIKKFTAAFIVLLVIFLTLFLWGKIRLLSRWGQFFKKLKKAQARGEITYEVEGRPYLSALFPSLYAGLKITDHQRHKGKAVSYRVAICNVKRRRGTVILCDDHMVQIRHEINLRMGSRALVIASAADNAGATTSQPLIHWYTNRGIEFPEGEGELVMLIDPAPTKLYVRQGYTERLFELDNGSTVFDYTVWTKNAFFNMIDRM